MAAHSAVIFDLSTGTFRGATAADTLVVGGGISPSSGTLDLGVDATTDINLGASGVETHVKGHFFLDDQNTNAVLWNDGTGEVIGDNTSLCWDDPDKFFGINTASPTAQLHVHNSSPTSGASILSADTTAAGSGPFASIEASAGVGGEFNLSIEADPDSNVIAVISGATAASALGLILAAADTAAHLAEWQLLPTGGFGPVDDDVQDLGTSSKRVRNVFAGGFWEGSEIADPAAPAADKGRLYFKDNGAGKTQLVVRFNTGAVQVVATQP